MRRCRVLEFRAVVTGCVQDKDELKRSIDGKSAYNNRNTFLSFSQHLTQCRVFMPSNFGLPFLVLLILALN